MNIRRLSFFYILLMAAASRPGAAAPMHCTDGEKVVFSCGTGPKIVSVCATRPLTARSGAISYRFGPEGRPEINWPPPGTSRKAIRSGLWVFSGGGGAWLAFHRPPFRYIVYTAIGRGWSAKAGLAVEKDGRLVTNMPCHGTPVSELGPDFFTRAGIEDDDTPFDLP